MLGRVEEQALDRYVHDCVATGHALCSDLGGIDLEETSLCEYARRSLLESRKAEHDWSRFDVRRELMRQGSTFPDDTWPVPALLRLVHDSFMQGPLVPDERRRGIWVTAALARLAEAGLPPDVVVRIAMRDELKRRITFSVIAASVVGTDPVDGGGRQHLRRLLKPWSEALQNCADQGLLYRNVPAEMSSEIAARALHGDFGEVFDRWLDATSVAGVLAWDLNAPPHGPLAEADLMLRGGDAVGQWIYDRNVHTSLNEWRRASLDWELRYTTSPDETAYDAGVPLPMLAQRPAYQAAVVAELVRRTRCPAERDHVVAGLTRHDLLEQAVLLIGEGHAEVPVRLLREAVRMYPDDLLLRNTLGFCLIPTDPDAALKHFSKCVPSMEVHAGLLAVNRAAALVRLDRFADALSATNTVADDGRPVLLWPCATLLAGDQMESSLELTTPGQWAAQLRHLLAT